MKLKLLLPFVLIVIIMNSCGVITKARYGNGLKLNIESNLFSKKSKSEIAAKEKKKTTAQTTNQTPVEKVAEEVVNTDISDNEAKTISPDNSTHFDSEKEADILKILPGVEKSTRSRIAKEIDSTKSSSTKKNTKTPAREMEPLATAAGILYYGGIAGNIIYSYSAFFIPVLSTLLFLAIMIGFILAIIAYSNIRRNGYEKKGAGLSLSIIILTALFILLMVALIAVIIATF